MHRLSTFWQWVIEVSAWGSRVAIFAMMVLIATDVIGRRFFAFSIMGVDEIVIALMVASVFLAWAYTESKNEHVKVDIIVAHLGGKTRSVLEVINLFVVLGIFSIIIWQTTVYALDAWHIGQTYYTSHLPVFPVRLIVPVGCFFFFLQVLQRLVSSIAELSPHRTQQSDN